MKIGLIWQDVKEISQHLEKQYSVRASKEKSHSRGPLIPTDLGNKLIPESIRCEIPSTTLSKLHSTAPVWRILVSMVMAYRKSIVHQDIMTQVDKAPHE